MIKKALAIAIVLVSSPAAALPAKDASYYCNAVASGGIFYNTGTAQWEPTRFKPDRKFVLKLRFLAQRQQKDLFDQLETVGDFEVTMTDAGTSRALPCANLKDFTPTNSIGKENWLVCVSSLSEYRFDLNANRFLGAYLQGYVNGKDTNDDTPAVTAGVCTKIN